ncbi:MAG: hypothetical protein IT422_07780 [Pirellulaceae bacterium]|nr:hypothetical protein [Pirellulaceae bacterium]
MSRASRQRDSLAPSLFPFLAVLLCTMGALVLILMLVVSAAHASALQIAKQSTQQTEEVESQLASANRGFQKQLTEARLELEKKRLGLQHLENHIQELLDEVEQLKRTAELAEADEQSDETERQAQADAISLLEKQLLEAGEKLKQKLDKPDGDKPIFAIIPYDGPNGTHRRPIYLECIEQGIRIQPEGILLRTEDLEPPYGPGNPLDAALRTIRTQYAPANHAVTSTAYPLLIVRPSGIRSYAMARAAMSGWDDQFGYELMGDEVELTFPDGEPGLTDKIVRALELARERQAALILAMPQKYRGLSQRDRPLSGGAVGGGTELGGYGSDAHGGSGYGGDYSSISGGQAGSGDGAYGAGGRGGWADGSSSDTAAALQGDGSQSNGTGDRPALSGNGPMGFGEGSTPGTNPKGTNPAGSAGGESLFGSAGSGSPAGGGSQAGNRSSSSANSSSSNAAGGAAGGSGGGSQMSGSQMAMPLNAPNQGGSSDSSSGSAGQSASGSQAGSSGGAPGSASQPPDDMNGQQASPQLSLNKDFNGQRQESTAPVASRRGRGWAWSQGPPSQTSVGRSIRLQCLADRWIVLPDSGKANDPSAIAITFDLSPQQRAERLAHVVAERVDSWGLALSGGYWKPTLVVDVAPDAQWRFHQLQQLLEGSGLDVQRSQ